MELRPNHSGALTALATLLADLDRPQEAAAIADRVLDAAPRTRDPAYHRTRGHAYRLAGKLEMAEESYRKAIALNPPDIESWEGLARTRWHNERDQELERLVRLREDAGLDEEQRISLDLVLGRWFDDIGDDATSYDYFARANAAIRVTLDYSTAREAADLDAMRGLFDPPPATVPPLAHDAPGPIFIVGEPRAGKSTVEGMLARHPRVRAAGELKILQVLSYDLSAAHGLSAPGAHISRVPAEELRRFGGAYLDFVRLMLPEGLVSIDTMPLNFRYVGLLRMALPNARIISCRRDPLDHAIALYHKRFPLKGFAYTYAFDELGAHLRLHDRFMGFWREAFPGFVHEVDAAELADATKARKLLEFCGLEWDSRCLGPHQSEPRLGDDRSRMAVRRRERRRFYEPLLRPYLQGSEGPAAAG